MSRFLFITDLHITTTCPVRTGNPLEDVCSKLRWCVDFVNEHDATLLLGGDIFDKPTVPLEAINMVIEVLRGCRRMPLGVWGNHDQLYRAAENNPKCALYTLASSRVIALIDDRDVEFEDCTVTNVLPLQTSSSPQILIYHGFLNQKDGRFTVPLSDIVSPSSPTLVLLGHDHIEYADLELSDSVTVVRPGSLFRNRRVETSERPPKGVYVEVSNGSISHSLVEVPARSFDSIFAVKTDGFVAPSEDVDYDKLLETLQASCGSDDLTFIDALSSVADEDVVLYCEGVVAESLQSSAR